jgi:hypothetical protein
VRLRVHSLFLKAASLICAIIHHRNKGIPETLAAGHLLGIAVTADKYDFVDALKFASGNWLRLRETNLEI